MGVWRTNYLIYGFKIEDEARLDVLGDHEEELMSMFKEACNGNYPENIYFSQEWVNS